MSSVSWVETERELVEKAASELGIPDHIKEYALSLNPCSLRGRTARERAAGKLLYACRKHGFAVLVDELACLQLSVKSIERAFRAIQRELGKVPPFSAEAYIPRLAKKLGYPEECEAKAREILQKIGRTTCKPSVAAVIALYTAGNLHGIRRPVAEIVKARYCSFQTFYYWTREFSKRLKACLEKERGEKLPSHIWCVVGKRQVPYFPTNPPEMCIKGFMYKPCRHFRLTPDHWMWYCGTPRRVTRDD